MSAVPLQPGMCRQQQLEAMRLALFNQKIDFSSSAVKIDRNVLEDFLVCHIRPKIAWQLLNLVREVPKAIRFR